jgi:hypothetical protein
MIIPAAIAELKIKYKDELLVVISPKFGVGGSFTPLTVLGVG